MVIVLHVMLNLLSHGICQIWSYYKVMLLKVGLLLMCYLHYITAVTILLWWWQWASNCHFLSTCFPCFSDPRSWLWECQTATFEEAVSAREHGGQRGTETNNSQPGYMDTYRTSHWIREWLSRDRWDYDMGLPARQKLGIIWKALGLWKVIFSTRARILRVDILRKIRGFSPC